MPPESSSIMNNSLQIENQTIIFSGINSQVSSCRHALENNLSLRGIPIAPTNLSGIDKKEENNEAINHENDL